MVASSTTYFARESEESRQATAPRHAALFVFMLLTLVWAPIPIGSNRVWSGALLQVGFFTLFGLWALAYAHRPFCLPGALSRARWPLILLSAWALFPLLQLVPLPAAVAEALGGPAQALYRDLPADLGCLLYTSPSPRD